MIINTDINILGGLPDWNLIKYYFQEDILKLNEYVGIQSFTTIKTDKSIKRFKKAINSTFFNFKNEDIKAIFNDTIFKKSFSIETQYFLYWIASHNNDLLHYINNSVFFPALYSGRTSLKIEEITACIKDLKLKEESLKKWSETTIKTTASKYLTLLKKFGLMEGKANKSILHPFLSDDMFIIFIYWLVAVSGSTNLLKSEWMSYSFSEIPHFLDRVMQKKFSKYFNIVYTGDKLSIEPIIPYNQLYDEIYQS